MHSLNTIEEYSTFLNIYIYITSIYIFILGTSKTMYVANDIV